MGEVGGRTAGERYDGGDLRVAARPGGRKAPKAARTLKGCTGWGVLAAVLGAGLNAGGPKG
jgi:hypothetical protein